MASNFWACYILGSQEGLCLQLCFKTSLWLLLGHEWSWSLEVY